MNRFQARYRDGYYVVIDTETGEVVLPPKGHYKRHQDGYLWSNAASHMANQYNADLMRKALKAGKRLRVVVGTEPDDPTIVLSLEDGCVICTSVAGWSAGVVEPACELESSYLETYLRHESIEVIE